MYHPIKKIRQTVAAIKTAFRLLITTLEANTAKVEALAAEQTVLRDKFDVLVKHTAFLANAKRQELTRAGHRVD